MTATKPRTAVSNAALARSEREILQSYLDDIYDTPVLETDVQNEILLGMEIAEEQFRRALASIPDCAQKLLDRWNDRRAHNRVTGSLSRWHRDGKTKNVNELIDTALTRVEKTLDQIDLTSGRRLESKLTEALGEAVMNSEIALPILLAIHEEVAGEAGSATSARARDRKRQLALADEFRARLTDNKNRFIAHNLRLVVRCAKAFRNRGVSFLDLIQEGNVGLIRAVEKFDFRRGYKFSTYAVWWIEQSLIRSVANDSRTIRIPSPILDQQRALRRVESEMRASVEAEPASQLLVEALGLSIDEGDALRRSLQPEISSHMTLSGMDDLTVQDTLRAEEVEDPDLEFDNEALRRSLTDLLPNLDDRARQVLTCHFGLEGREPISLAQIGQSIGVSRERVRQIERAALDLLRENDLVRELGQEWGCC